MASFGKISNSLIQGTNENTFALANLNFDFSLVSFAPPTEFTAVGTALAQSRRENAEHGAQHRTARKLGALFEGLVPQVPGLVSAYGKRASEIMKHPNVNPSGNADEHGPFAAFVGADATSIWAAATSGGPSIGIHLLGCLLARSFSDPTKSTSALVELVHERQKQIRNERNTFASTATHLAALMAAEQEIQREELQQWDSSARAWLQTADTAMRKEHIQLKLILHNISLPVTSASTLYDGIIRAWTQAMHGLECLMNGQSQSVTDGAILLAISAWHLYPNLLVLGRESTNVDFGDRGIQSSGLLTVGITNAESSTGTNEGIYWSMALSHYRYYGRALNAVGEIDDRMTIDQLHLVAFGSLLRDWNVSRKDIKPAAKWLNALEGCLSRTKEPLGCPPWLTVLSKAAKDVLAADSLRKKEVLALIDFGQRRGSNFLSPRSQPCLPWFGLRFSHIVGALTAKTAKECAVQYLRNIARAGNLRHDSALITYIAHTATGDTKSLHEYFTANTRKDSRLDEKLRQPNEVADTDIVSDLEDDFPKTTSADRGGSKASDDQKSPNLSRHQSWSGSFFHPCYEQYYRPDSVFDSGEKQAERSNTNVKNDKSTFGSLKLPAPLQYEHQSHNASAGLLAACHAVLPHGMGWFASGPVRFQKFMGDPSSTTRLWLAQARAVEFKMFTKKIQLLQSGATAKLLDMETATQLLSNDRLEPRLVWNYLNGVCYEAPGPIELKEVLRLMQTERNQFRVTLESLRSLATATNIYNGLDGATISNSIVETGLHDAKWAIENPESFATRSRVFSCIAMMETGKINLGAEHLKQVIALSSGNSLFVSTRLLTDPYDEVAGSSVTRIVGNVGRPGVSLLVPPAASPLARPLSTSFRAVTYAPFDGRREDNFKGTTLHLSFTSHRFPLDYGVTGIVDHQVFVVESIISIHDSGQWVADLDTLEAFRIGNDRRIGIQRGQQQKLCEHPEGMLDSIFDDITSLDTWEEVLDTNPGINIVRAHKNWPARLAASVMLSKTRRVGPDSDKADSEILGATGRKKNVKNERYSILENGDDVCWVCFHHRLSETSGISTADPFYIIS